MSGPRRSAPWSAFCLDPGSAHRASHQPICRRNRAPRSRHGARHPLGISLSPKAAGRWPVFSVTLLLRRQAPVWTRLWHEDVRLSHCPIHYVCLCLQDEPSVIAQQARLLLVFHGLLLGHRHRLRPQADQGSFGETGRKKPGLADLQPAHTPRRRDVPIPQPQYTEKRPKVPPPRKACTTAQTGPTSAPTSYWVDHDWRIHVAVVRGHCRRRRGRVCLSRDHGQSDVRVSRRPPRWPAIDGPPGPTKLRLS
jgi:hypothetical protein